jgi:hypothetical protein
MCVLNGPLRGHFRVWPRLLFTGGTTPRAPRAAPPPASPSRRRPSSHRAPRGPSPAGELAVGFFFPPRPRGPLAGIRCPPSAFFSPLLVSLLRFNFLSPRWLTLQSLLAAAPTPQPTCTLRANTPPRQTRPQGKHAPRANTPYGQRATQSKRAPQPMRTPEPTRTSQPARIGLLRLVSHTYSESASGRNWRASGNDIEGAIGPSITGTLAPSVRLSPARWRHRSGAGGPPFWYPPNGAVGGAPARPMALPGGGPGRGVPTQPAPRDPATPQDPPSLPLRARVRRPLPPPSGQKRSPFARGGSRTGMLGWESRDGQAVDSSLGAAWEGESAVPVSSRATGDDGNGRARCR